MENLAKVVEDLISISRITHAADVAGETGEGERPVSPDAGTRRGYAGVEVHAFAP